MISKRIENKTQKVCWNCGVEFAPAGPSTKYCSPLCFHVHVAIEMEKYHEFKQMFDDCIKNSRMPDEID